MHSSCTGSVRIEIRRLQARKARVERLIARIEKAIAESKHPLLASRGEERTFLQGDLQ